MSIFDIRWIAADIGGYPLSYLELTGVISGLASVWLMAKEKRAGWFFGLLNAVLAGLLYYQVQLYADFFLQFYFFFTCLYGWWFWQNSRQQQGVEVPVTSLHRRGWILVILMAVTGTISIGMVIRRLHVWLPVFFPQPAAYPFADTVVLCLSLIAQYLMAKKILESWLIWIVVDVLATYLYFQKHVWFLAFEYFVFLMMAIAGWFFWRRNAIKNN